MDTHSDETKTSTIHKQTKDLVRGYVALTTRVETCGHAELTLAHVASAGEGRKLRRGVLYLPRPQRPVSHLQHINRPGLPSACVVSKT